MKKHFRTILSVIIFETACGAASAVALMAFLMVNDVTLNEYQWQKAQTLPWIFLICSVVHIAAIRLRRRTDYSDKRRQGDDEASGDQDKRRR